MHVSTVYNNLDKEEIEEIVYPATFDPEKLTEIVDCMNDQLLASITKQYVNLRLSGYCIYEMYL